MNFFKDSKTKFYPMDPDPRSYSNWPPPKEVMDEFEAKWERACEIDPNLKKISLQPDLGYCPMDDPYLEKEQERFKGNLLNLSEY